MAWRKLSIFCKRHVRSWFSYCILMQMSSFKFFGIGTKSVLIRVKSWRYQIYQPLTPVAMTSKVHWCISVFSGLNVNDRTLSFKYSREYYFFSPLDKYKVPNFHIMRKLIDIESCHPIAFNTTQVTISAPWYFHFADTVFLWRST